MTTRMIRTTATVTTRFAPVGKPDRISGLAVAYGETFTRWGVEVVYRPGGIKLPPQGVETVKLLVEHDTDKAIGYAVSAEDGAAGLAMEFELPQLPHTQAMRHEIDAGIRDGLSVGVALDDDCVAALEELMWGDEQQTEPLELTGTLREVSACVVPQFNSARVTNQQQEEAQPMPELVVTTTAPEAAAAPVPAPAAARTAAAAPSRTEPRSASHDLATRLIAARRDGGAAGPGAVLTAALADITPGGNGAGNELAGLAVEAAGELWAENGYDPIYDVCVTPARLNSIKIHGWRWAVPPTVGDYAGNKTPIPSNEATLEYAETTAQRIAGGHDLDRIYVDLGDADVVRSYWREMAYSLAVQLDAKRMDQVEAAAGTPGTATSLVRAILDGLHAVEGATYVLIAQDLWEAEGATPVDELPALLTGAGIFGPLLPSTIVAGVGLPAGTVIVGDRAAIDFRTFEPPVRLEGVNIPQAGVDAGLYSYWASLLNKTGRVKAVTVTPARAARQAK